jgi:membrane fusion protein, heavy metal efflux system
MDRRLVIGIVAALVVVVAWLVLRHRAGGSSSVPQGAPAETAASARGEGAGADSVVSLDSTALRLAGIQLTTVGTNAGGNLTANGTITYDANHVSVIAPPSAGRVVAVRADLGEHVAPGALLALLQSADVGQTRGDLARASANLDVTRQNYEREQRLYNESISSQKEMLEAQGAYRMAQADLNAAAAKLRSMGAAAGEGATFGLTTPIAGTVVERTAMPGQIVGPSTNLFTIADLHHVWIVVDVYEGDVARVTTGAPAEVVTRAMPNRVFQGRVAYAGGVVDTTTRTLKIRVDVDNAGQLLRPGMYAQVRIAARTPAASVSGTAPRQVIVPAVAVQDLNGRSVVFVPSGAPGRFLVRQVTLGPDAAGDSVSIVTGLRAGDRVVTAGAFQLKSELLKASFGDKD